MIVLVDAERDEHGYWTHPALIRSGCETPRRTWLLAEKSRAAVLCDDHA